MTEEQLTKGLTYLGTAYGKEYTQLECQQHYDFLQDYSYATFVKAIKNIIKKSKFLPKINELIEECDSCKDLVKFDVLDYMSKQGYFKANSEFEKASRYLETGVIPEWFKEDLNKYYKLMNNSKLEHKETLLIG